MGGSNGHRFENLSFERFESLMVWTEDARVREPIKLLNRCWSRDGHTDQCKVGTGGLTCKPDFPLRAGTQGQFMRPGGRSADNLVREFFSEFEARYADEVDRAPSLPAVERGILSRPAAGSGEDRRLRW